MCNLNQVLGGMQRYHYSCCRRKVHHIVAAPCCCGRDRTTPESSEMGYPPRCPGVTGISKVPAAVRTSVGSKGSGKSSSSNQQDPSKATIQRRESNKSSNSSVYSMNKTLPKRSSIQTRLSPNGMKSQRSSGGSVEIHKNKGSCICTICEEDALVSGCSSNCDCDSTNTIFPTKSKRTSQGIKPRNSKSDSQNSDVKALVRAKPKRKRIVARKWPSRSTECPIERPSQETNDDDGIWFECNLPFRVNIPFPISMQNLFGLQTLPAKDSTQTCHSKALVPARKLTQNGTLGMPFCLTMRNALPAPVPDPEPQPSTSKAATYLPRKKGLKRGRKRTCPCETSTQTGEDDPVLCCLEQIKNQLAAKSTEGQEKPQCRCFAEKSTNVRTLQAQKKVIEVAKTSEEKKERIKSKPPKIVEETSARSVESSSSKSSQKGIVMKPPSKTKKTEKKPKKTNSITSSTSLQSKSSKSSQNEVLSQPTSPKKNNSSTSASSVQESSSKSSSQNVENHSQENLKKSQVVKPIKSSKPKRIVEKNPVLNDPEPEVENHSQEKLQREEMKSEATKTPKPRGNVEESISEQKKNEWIDPEPYRKPSFCFCGRPQIFLEYQSAIQGSANHWHSPIYQSPQYRDHPQSWENWQTQGPEMQISPITETNNNASFNRNNTPENNSQFQKSSSNLDQDPSKPSISPRGCACHYARKSVDIINKSKISGRARCSCFEKSQYNSPDQICEEDSKSKNSYDEKEKIDELSERSNLRREFPSSRDNARDIGNLESSKEHSRERLPQSSVDLNGLETNKKKINRSPNSETLSRGSENPRSSGRENKAKLKNQAYDRISSGGETIDIEGFDGISRTRKSSYDDQLNRNTETSPRKHSPEELPCPSQGIEIKSVSGLISMNKLSQEFYFPLSNKTSRTNRPLSLQEKVDITNKTDDTICSQAINSNADRSLSGKISLSRDEVVKTDEYQYNYSESSDKRPSKVSYSVSSRKMSVEPKIKDNISYKLENSRDGKSEDQISSSFPSRSFSIVSEALYTAPLQAKNSHNEIISLEYSDETPSKLQNLSESNGTGQKVSAILQEVSFGTKMGKEMSQYSENLPTKVPSSIGSTGTDNIPSTSCKSSEIFQSRLIYSQFKRQSPEKNISPNHIKRNSVPKDQSISNLNTRPVSGMNMRSNNRQYLNQAENRQRSPTINTNRVLANKKKRSQSAPACLVLQYGEKYSKRPCPYRRNLSPRNHSPREHRILPQRTKNVLVIQDESCESEMERIFPAERIREQYELQGYRMAHYPLQKGGKDMRLGPSDCRTPDYSINASITQSNQQFKEDRCFIPERTPIPRYVPEYISMQRESPRNLEYLNADNQNTRQNPPVVLMPFRMESREIVNVCQPDEWRELRLHLSTVNSNQLQMIPEVRGRSQPRKHPTEEDSSAGYHSSSESQSEEEYFPFSRPNTPEQYNYCRYHQKDISSVKRTILETRQRRPGSYTSSQSEEGYVSHSKPTKQVERMEPKATRKSHKLSITSDSSCPHSPASTSNDSVKSRGSRKVAGKILHDSSNQQVKEKPENRNKPSWKLGGNSHISIGQSDCRCYIDYRDTQTLPSNSDNQTSEHSGLPSEDTVVTSAEQAQHCSCYPSCSLNQTIASERTTDMETLETVTLMHPRRLRSNESTRIGNPDRDTENTVLLEIRTTCKKNNLLETCARPPYNFSRQHYTGTPPIEDPVQSQNYQRSSNLDHHNGKPFEENYLIDPRDHWMTMKSPPGCQQRHTILVMDPHQSGQRPCHHFPFHSPFYNPEPVREKIKQLPEGFYDQTINKYNIIRMDSDFQPPPLGPEIIQVLKAQPQFHYGSTGSTCGSPSQRPFSLPENQYHPRLPYRLPPFCPQQNVKLDGYHQSESQF